LTSGRLMSHTLSRSFVALTKPLAAQFIDEQDEL
jgi:hypothetical protein